MALQHLDGTVPRSVMPEALARSMRRPVIKPSRMIRHLCASERGQSENERDEKKR